MCQFWQLNENENLKMREDKSIPDLMSMAGSYWLCCRYHGNLAMVRVLSHKWANCNE